MYTIVDVYKPYLNCLRGSLMYYSNFTSVFYYSCLKTMYFGWRRLLWSLQYFFDGFRCSYYLFNCAWRNYFGNNSLLFKVLTKRTANRYYTKLLEFFHSSDIDKNTIVRARHFSLCTIPLNLKLINKCLSGDQKLL